ncbi:hypothetical protein [Bdellovibrio sp. HCB337]|uniref:hypothetical protein n=1 Tax=Bdellovibrio sp. HCB337 TaxID=3394358 RepID=UPI0039A580E3
MKKLILVFLVLTACGSPKEPIEQEPYYTCQLVAAKISVKHALGGENPVPLRTHLMTTVAEAIGADSQSCPPVAAIKQLDERLSLECGDFLCKVGRK